jgi:hypothetical protein
LVSPCSPRLQNIAPQRRHGPERGRPEASTATDTNSSYLVLTTQPSRFSRAARTDSFRGPDRSASPPDDQTPARPPRLLPPWAAQAPRRHTNRRLTVLITNASPHLAADVPSSPAWSTSHNVTYQ